MRPVIIQDFYSNKYNIEITSDNYHHEFSYQNGALNIRIKLSPIESKRIYLSCLKSTVAISCYVLNDRNLFERTITGYFELPTNFEEYFDESDFENLHSRAPLKIYLPHVGYDFLMNL